MRTRADYDHALARFREWRAQFLGDDGELRDKFQPKPLEPSFLRPEGADATERDSIPVPKGPVDNW
jgi:hypothetical protein